MWCSHFLCFLINKKQPKLLPMNERIKMSPPALPWDQWIPLDHQVTLKWTPPFLPSNAQKLNRKTSCLLAPIYWCINLISIYHTQSGRKREKTIHFIRNVIKRFQTHTHRIYFFPSLWSCPILNFIFSLFVCSFKACNLYLSKPFS